MALRDKLRDRVQPKLQEGETIQQVFLAQTGPSPYFLFLTSIFFFLMKYWVVAVTDRRIVIFRAGTWTSSFPKEQAAEFPRSTKFGPVGGLWGKFELGDTKYWVHKRFHGDVEAADAAAA
jgi:hypothetical protein